MKKTDQPKSNEQLGDIPAADFRKQLHEVADWIADYRENMAEHRISPSAPAGSDSRRAPDERAGGRRKLGGDSEGFPATDLPGHGPLGAPSVCRLFRLHHHRTRHSRGDVGRHLEHQRDDLAHFAGRD